MSLERRTNAEGSSFKYSKTCPSQTVYQFLSETPIVNLYSSINKSSVEFSNTTGAQILLERS